MSDDWRRGGGKWVGREVEQDGMDEDGEEVWEEPCRLPPSDPTNSPK